MPDVFVIGIILPVKKSKSNTLYIEKKASESESLFKSLKGKSDFNAI
jgi:hypothetical protein